MKIDDKYKRDGESIVNSILRDAEYRIKKSCMHAMIHCRVVRPFLRVEQCVLQAR